MSEGSNVTGDMYILSVNKEASAVKNKYNPGQTLVPYDNITSIRYWQYYEAMLSTKTYSRISFYSLRLAKSDVFTPRLWEYKWIVDEYIQTIKEENSFSESLQTSGNNLTLLDKKFQNKDSDWDSGFSDG